MLLPENITQAKSTQFPKLNAVQEKSGGIQQGRRRFLSQPKSHIETEKPRLEKDRVDLKIPAERSPPVSYCSGPITINDQGDFREMKVKKMSCDL